MHLKGATAYDALEEIALDANLKLGVSGGSLIVFEEGLVDPQLASVREIPWSLRGLQMAIMRASSRARCLAELKEAKLAAKRPQPITEKSAIDVMKKENGERLRVLLGWLDKKYKPGE